MLWVKTVSSHSARETSFMASVPLESVKSEELIWPQLELCEFMNRKAGLNWRWGVWKDQTEMVRKAGLNWRWGVFKGPNRDGQKGCRPKHVEKPKSLNSRGMSEIRGSAPGGKNNLDVLAEFNFCEAKQQEAKLSLEIAAPPSLPSLLCSLYQFSPISPGSFTNQSGKQQQSHQSQTWRSHLPTCITVTWLAAWIASVPNKVQ